MTREEKLQAKVKTGPRLGNYLIPESVVAGTGRTAASPLDRLRYAMANQSSRASLPQLPAAPPPMTAPGQAIPAAQPLPAMAPRAPVTLGGPNPFAAKAAQMGFADFGGAQRAQAQALRGAAK